MCDRKAKKPFIRSRRARSDCLRNRTTGAIRNEFRNDFFDRLRNNRSRSVDRFRQIVQNYGELLTYRSVTDLRTVLEADPEAASLMRDAEVNDALNQIELELSQVDLKDEGDQHEVEFEKETDEILKTHFVICKICRGMNPEGDICLNCSDSLKREFGK